MTELVSLEGRLKSAASMAEILARQVAAIGTATGNDRLSRLMVEVRDNLELTRLAMAVAAPATGNILPFRRPRLRGRSSYVPL